MAEKYQKAYHEYTDATDEGMDAKILSSAALAKVRENQAGWQKAFEAGDQETMDRLHRENEAIRGKAGYSGGANGGAYNPFAQADTGTHVSATHMTSPTWSAPYQKEQAAAVKALQAQKPFSYDPESDPTYQQYKQTYTRMGEKARDDTIGVMRARGGGALSSYAEIAAQQANEAYMQQLADKVPELRQLAYEMWLKEGDRLRSDAQMYDSLNSSDAARWSSTVLDPFQSDRTFGLDYDRYLSDRDDAAWEKGYKEKVFQADRDDADWEKGYKEKAYQADRDDVDFDRRRDAADILAAGDDYSGYGSLYGLTDEQVQALAELAKGQRALETEGATLDNEYKRAQINAAKSSGRGSSGSVKPKVSNELYDTVLKKAKTFDSQEDALQYLNNMVNLYGLDPNQAAYIYQVELGGVVEDEPATDPTIADMMRDKITNAFTRGLQNQEKRKKG